VAVAHHSIVNTLIWRRDYYCFGPGDVSLQIPSFVFDSAVNDIFTPLVGGSCLVMIRQENRFDLAYLSELILEYKVTHFVCTPGYYQTFMDEIYESMKGLKAVCVAGDRLSEPLVKEHLEKLPHVNIHNEYGPSENSVNTTAYCFSPGATTVLIGKPDDNVSCFILDPYEKITPTGIRGEMCLSGKSLAMGYLNAPQLTAEKFVPNPYHCGEKMYKTGDIARWLPDGNLEFMGRIDLQVKIRGHRIEPGEIEHQLLKHEKIKDSLVLVRETPGDRSEDKLLAAYIAVEGELHAPEIRGYLSKLLPEYMVPSYFFMMDKLPLTHNGKIDRTALPEPVTGEGPDDGASAAPRDETEEKLVTLWSGVLDVEKDKISIDSSFFNLGGHSLKAIVLISKIHKELSVRIPLVEFFRASTIRELAAYIKGTSKDTFLAIEPAEKKDYYPLSSAQKRLYILQQLDYNNIIYNMPQILELEGNVEIEKMNEIFRQLVYRHDSFRTSFELNGDEPVQRVHEHVDFEIEVFDLAGTAGDMSLPEFIRQHTFIRPFDLSQAPLVRVNLIHAAEGKHLLLIDMHHIITDAVSHEILEREYRILYNGGTIPELTIQYKEYAEWQNSRKQKEISKQQERYWLSEFQGDIPLLNMPLDYKRNGEKGFEGGTLIFEIDDELTAKVRTLAMEKDVTLMILLLAAYKTLLSKYSGQEEILVGTVIAGRRHMDLEKIIGFFVNFLAIRTAPGRCDTFSQYLAEVKRKAVRAYENQDYPF
ncbi:MAG: AMP-binding protein, partial [bacterium]|nr:AMP-binding protein [bacterium]